MTETTQAALVGAGAVCGALLTMLGLAGAFWRIALPWLREQIVAPVQATHEQVANTHSTNLRDDLDRIEAKVDRAIEDVGDVDTKASRIGNQLDAHLTVAATTDAATHARLTALERRDH